MSSPDDLERRIMAFVRAFGLHQAYAITELAAQPLTQAELSRRLRLDRSVVSRLADVLIKRGGCGASDIHTISVRSSSCSPTSANVPPHASRERAARA